MRLPYGHQLIDAQDLDAVSRVLSSEWLTQGPAVEAFERDLATAVGARHVVAVSSGTAALHLACLAAGVGPGHTVLTSAMTFVASANAALYCGADAGLVDVDPETITLDPEALGRALARAERPVKAIIPVDFAGHPAEHEAMLPLARAQGAVLIDDACHALGAEWRDRAGAWHRIGDGSAADMTVFSFHPVKLITTGEGGAIATNADDLAERLRELRTHGITRDPAKLTRNDGPWYYEMQHLGYNYRLTDIQCALGRSQLERLTPWVARRREIALRYDAAFADVPGIRPLRQQPWGRSAYHLYVIRVDAAVVPGGRARLFGLLRERGLGVQVHYIPVHYQPVYARRFGYRPGMFPQAERYYDEAISLPMFPGLTDENVATVIETVAAAVAATRARVPV
jgi:perosamine synthetase